MSRTDKDRPYFVLLTDATLRRRERHDHRFQVCDLDPSRLERPYDPSLTNTCYLSLVAERYGTSTPKWKRDHHWHNPQRVRERVELGQFLKAHRAGDNLEDADFPCPQGRRGSRHRRHNRPS